MQHDHDAAPDGRRSSRVLRNILIADDNDLFAAGTAELLRGEDFAVRTVACGGDVVPAIEEQVPDALILDIGLPDILGTEVSAEVARRWLGIPVVFVSGHAEPADLATNLADPRVTFLRKPFAFDDLLVALERVIQAADGDDDSG